VTFKLSKAVHVIQRLRSVRMQTPVGGETLVNVSDRTVYKFEADGRQTERSPETAFWEID
jgi:hypothetical protein